MKKDGRFNIRLERELVEQVKKYARRNQTTVSALIENHLRGLLDREKQVRLVPEAEQF